MKNTFMLYISTLLFFWGCSTPQTSSVPINTEQTTEYMEKEMNSMPETDFISEKELQELVETYNVSAHILVFHTKFQPLSGMQRIDPNQKGGFERSLQQLTEARSHLDSDIIPFCSELKRLGEEEQNINTQIASLYCNAKGMYDFLSVQREFTFPDFVERIQETLEDEDLDPNRRVQLQEQYTKIEELEFNLLRQSKEIEMLFQQYSTEALSMSNQQKAWPHWSRKLSALQQKNEESSK